MKRFFFFSEVFSISRATTHEFPKLQVQETFLIADSIKVIEKVGKMKREKEEDRYLVRQWVIEYRSTVRVNLAVGRVLVHSEANC